MANQRWILEGLRANPHVIRAVIASQWRRSGSSSSYSTSCTRISECLAISRESTTARTHTHTHTHTPTSRDHPYLVVESPDEFQVSIVVGHLVRREDDAVLLLGHE